MSGRCEVFSNVVLAFLSVIGTFVLLVRFGCVFKPRGACIDKTRKLRQKSVCLHADKNKCILVDPGPDQAKAEEDMNRDLTKLVERTQNSDKYLTSKEKVFAKTKEAANDAKKDKKEKLYSSKRNEHQILIQETVTPEVGQYKTQSTQQDDFKDSKAIDQIHYSVERSRKRRSDMGKRNKNNILEEAREAVAKNQSREEEPSTLEGVASIDRDDAPSSDISQLRNNGSVKINFSRRRAVSRNSLAKRRFIKNHS